jgi:hypothetical protein
MASVSQAPPPVRKGTCRLLLSINSDVYSLKRLPPIVSGGRCWALRKRTGERAGAIYSVAKARGSIACSCPDFSVHKAPCKHIRAVVAAGLLSGRKGGAR